MEKVIAALGELENINTRYEVANEPIASLRAEIAEAKVCTPIIGKFSSGKSALVNTLLGYSKGLLKIDIVPETAVPAEIEFSEEEGVWVLGSDGTRKAISIEDYKTFEADARTVKSARLKLNNSFLRDIPDVMLVDMPGFESGIEIHNKAIDDYLPQSLAYIVAFPADDMIVRSSVGDILRELCTHDMPICVVITKMDKANDDFDETFAHLQKSLKKYIGEREVVFCKTSSHLGDAEELKAYLKEIQRQSHILLARKFKQKLLPLIDNTQNYLKTALTSSSLSESELDEKEDKLKKQMSALESRFAHEQETFNNEIKYCAEEIKNDARMALDSEESAFVAMALNNQDIKDRLTVIIRNAVALSVKKRFAPRADKYLRRVSNVVSDVSIDELHISFALSANDFDSGLSDALTKGIATIVTGFIAGLPILGTVSGIFIAIVKKLINSFKRDQVKQEIRRKLQTECFPQVINEVGMSIELAITKQIQLINKSIEDELKNQQETLEKALADVRRQMNEEKQAKEKLEADIKCDLERLGAVKNGL